MLPAESCLFCAKLRRLDELPPDEVVWRFPRSVALLGPWQYYRGYCVLVSRTHAVELHDLANAEREAYLAEMCCLAQAISRAVEPLKLNYEMLGNQVRHLHWHIFPRFRNDPEHLKPVWLALDRAERDPAVRQEYSAGPCERAATVTLLRQHLTALGAPQS